MSFLAAYAVWHRPTPVRLVVYHVSASRSILTCQPAKGQPGSRHHYFITPQAFPPSLRSALQEHAITSDEALALDDLPEHNHTVVTVGAGYISLEFAHIFHGFGCETHVMYRKAKPLRGCVYIALRQLVVDYARHSTAAFAPSGAGCDC
jgi:Pyridine nucleotide-disulphide oxidoreductase